MATLKLCLKNDFVKSDGKCNIKIRFSHDRKVRYLKTSYNTEPNFIGRDGRKKQRQSVQNRSRPVSKEPGSTCNFFKLLNQL